MELKVVSKFGGSSVKNAQALQQVATIIKNELPSLVVISATHNTTNQLEQLVNASKEKKPFDHFILEIKEKHIVISKELNIYKQCFSQICTLTEEARELCKTKDIDKSVMDQIYSIGERLSSVILFKYLISQGTDCVLLDARKFIKTDSDFGSASPNIDLIKLECLSIKKEFGNRIFITQGFIGSDINGNTTTLGREGSDYSASLFAEALNAEQVNIWTDVIGVATSDPRICTNAKFFKNLSYDQAELMASNGAKVLFRRTLAPVKRLGIPLFVKSTFQPNEIGTCISNTTQIVNDKPIGMTIENNIITIIGGNVDTIKKQLGLTDVIISKNLLKFNFSEGMNLNDIHSKLFNV